MTTFVNKTTKSNKMEIAIFADEKDLYKTFKRALMAVGRITTLRFEETDFKNKKNVILIVTNEDKLKALLYEKIRSKHLNPVVVIGFKEKEQFEKDYPLFNDHPFNHAYLSIPFDLSELVKLFNEAMPISSQAIREAICGSDPDYKGYLLKLLSHDLLKDIERCIEILKMTDNYFNDKKISDEVKGAIKKIKRKEPDWSPIAFEAGKKIENRIKERL